MPQVELTHFAARVAPVDLPTVAIPGLYVHIPFCFHKCHYCDFYSITQQTPQRMEGFVTLLLSEARMWATGTGPKVTPRTVFFGGGTPTLLPAAAMRRLIAGLREIFDLGGVDEWTVEANPATVDESYCSMLRSLGVNRISFGAQSFDLRELAVLERHHDPEDVPRSVEIARRTGFERMNVDLIFAIPGQTLGAWLASLESALALRTTHLSAYNLTYEPNTPMTVKKRLGQIIPVDEATELTMLQETRRRLTDAGLPPYEISNFAAPGQECRHNLLYWSGDDYISLGPSAASHVQGHRWKNCPNLGQWESAIERAELPVIDLEILSPRQRAGELAMLQLRLSRGLDFVDFAARTGQDASRLFAAPISRYIAEGLLECDSIGFHLTPAGLPVADAIAAEFLQ
jgi:oxygen-independent coproporphyrinogen-3 oxidase